MADANVEWLAAARARADRPPLIERRPLRIDGGVVGSVEPAVADRLIAAGLLVGDSAACILRGPPDTGLEAVAAWLHREGLARRWRDERLVVTGSDGRRIGAVERSVVRVLGITTFAVHLAASAVDGAEWVQLRAHDKATDPGLWDTMMGGQVADGESIEATLERETREETGLHIGDLHDLSRRADLLIRRPVAEGYMIEHLAVFAARVPDGVVPQNRDGEVERFECLAEPELLERLAAAAFTLEATLILGAELERRSSTATG